MTTVLPAISAPAAGPPASAIGKLKGLMTAHTPCGLRIAAGVLRRRERAHRLHEAVVALHLVAVVAQQVGRLLHVAQRLEPVLADLEGHERGVVELPLADQVGGACG